ncbi:MAG: peroxiredoxin, partial [Candidatus Anstonellales archaeon]
MPALKKAVDFCLKDAYGKEHCLKELMKKYKYIVLYFYPKDNTPGCTTEAIEFTSLKKEFEGMNAFIIGISADSCKSHENFIIGHNLGITLLSDENMDVIKAYNAFGEKSFMGRVFKGIMRKTFLISEGKIIKEW